MSAATASAPAPLTAIDLFAGAGGLTCGLRAAQFNVRAAVEIDFDAAVTYLMNHNSTRVLATDIREVTGPELMLQASLNRGDLDLMTACPPCQSFSTLRTKRRPNAAAAPSDGSQNLILEVLRLVRSTRPRAVLLENVPGLAEDRNFECFRTGLSNAGYDSDFRVLDAKDYGVPQRRRRLVLIALRHPLRIGADWWKPFVEQRTTVRDAIGHLPVPGNTGDPLHDAPEVRTAKVMDRIAAVPRDGGSRRDLPENHRLACHQKSDGYSDVYGRMSWEDVAPTITSGCTNPSKGRFLHPDQNRAITLREAALLQSFPQDYSFALLRGKEECARQIGNAFPPSLILPIAARLKKQLDDAKRSA